MKIKADNRGRVSLAQAGIGKPHQEWEVTEDESGVHLTNPEQETSKWQHWSKLDPSLVGKVVGIRFAHREREGGSRIPKVPDSKVGVTVYPGTFGVLEWYETNEDWKDMSFFHDALPVFN